MEPHWTGLAPNPPSHLSIRWATPAEIDDRGRGTVSKPETINYRTLRPEPGGLFDEDVFGSLSAGEGEDQRAFLQEMFRDRRGEPVKPAPHTTRFGVVELPVELLHPLWKTRFVHQLAAATGWDEEQIRGLLDRSLRMEVETGDLGQYEELLEIESLAGAAAIRHRLQARGEPTDMIIDRVLVVPAFTRPLVPLDEGRFATSDLNDLYRRVVNRKNRLARLLELDAPEIILRNEARLLQEALEQLFDNDHDEVQTVTNPDGKPLRSLSSLAWGEGA